MPRPDPRCHACGNAGYLHMLAMRKGEEEMVIPCPECIAGKRYASFLRKLHAKESPPAELKPRPVRPERDANEADGEQIADRERPKGMAGELHGEEVTQDPGEYE